MTPREITGLRAVALAAPGLPGELTFFRDVWGLRPAAEAGPTSVNPAAQQ